MVIALPLALIMLGCTPKSSPYSAPVPSQPATSQAAPQATPPAAPTAFISVSSSGSLGDYLAGPNGMTLYTFTKDEANKSNCAGQCAVNWPALAPVDPMPSVPGLTGTLGKITRDDGSSQVTYNGKPLYYWINDKNPGDVTGEGVGGVWFVAKP